MSGHTTDGFGDYGAFAWLYDREWGENSLQFVPALDRLVLDGLPVGSRILDLACGTGQVAALLAERGYRVTGLDVSEEMLAFARSHAPGVAFVQADARTFELPDTVDAVLSLYDSLNHIMSVDDLREVLARVRAVLVPGGRFVFDLNTEDAHPAGVWRDSFVGEDYVAVVQSSYDAEARKARFVAILFRPSGEGWERTDVTLLQRCHTEGEVRDALRRAGFIDVVTVPAGDLGLRPGRLFYAAAVPA